MLSLAAVSTGVPIRPLMIEGRLRPGKAEPPPPLTLRSAPPAPYFMLGASFFAWLLSHTLVDAFTLTK